MGVLGNMAFYNVMRVKDVVGQAVVLFVVRDGGPTAVIQVRGRVTHEMNFLYVANDDQ